MRPIYGAKEIRAVLALRGVAVSDKMVAELMDEMNIHSVRNGAKKDYLRFNANKIKDSLKMKFLVDAPNQVWVSDVTYFKLNGKFQFICAIIDLYSRKVIAHKVSKKHSAQLIIATFKYLIWSLKPYRSLTARLITVSKLLGFLPLLRLRILAFLICFIDLISFLKQFFVTQVTWLTPITMSWLTVVAALPFKCISPQRQASYLALTAH